MLSVRVLRLLNTKTKRQRLCQSWSWQKNWMRKSYLKYASTSAVRRWRNTCLSPSSSCIWSDTSDWEDFSLSRAELRFATCFSSFILMAMMSACLPWRSVKLVSTWLYLCNNTIHIWYRPRRKWLYWSTLHRTFDTVFLAHNDAAIKARMNFRFYHRVWTPSASMCNE